MTQQVKRRQGWTEGQMVAVEEEATGPKQGGEVAVEPNQWVGLDPVECGRAEHRVHFRRTERFYPVRRREICRDPAQPTVHSAESTASDGEQHRIEVHRDRVRLRETVE